MTTYRLLLNLDAAGEPMGFFSFRTTVGEIVVAFTQDALLQQAAALASDVMGSQGGKIGWIALSADSPEALLGELMSRGAFEADLVLDTDRLGQQLLAQMASV
ncbi:hypothetical protein [Geodermatophilus sp. URMC 62]|uniref:hypothetical protein n=1 Tax=Geodermatophilus sp. URMC 62 TaxID=3423414 RepID=UPI00406CA99B